MIGRCYPNGIDVVAIEQVTVILKSGRRDAGHRVDKFYRLLEAGRVNIAYGDDFALPVLTEGFDVTAAHPAASDDANANTGIRACGGRGAAWRGQHGGGCRGGGGEKRAARNSLHESIPLIQRPWSMTSPTMTTKEE